MLLVSQVGTLVGLLVMARPSSLWLLFLGRVIDGATAGNLSLAQAYIADNTEPENRAHSFALIGIAFGLGFFLGPSMTGYLSQYGLRAPVLRRRRPVADEHRLHAALLPNEQPRRRATPDADGRPGGKRLGVSDWGAYAQYFERPVLAGLLVQFFLFALRVRDLHVGLRAVRRARLRLARPAVHAARDRLSVRLRRLPRHHPAGRPDRPPGEALRRAGAGRGRLRVDGLGYLLLGFTTRCALLASSRRWSPSARACCGRR